MALKRSFIFIINIVFGLCIGNLRTLSAVRPLRSIVPNEIPIRPLDRSTMQRLSMHPTELNPDAEPIFLPNHLTNPRPLQIMERISVPVDWNHPSAEKFNVLNFDAYVMKPKHGHLSVNPVTERVFRMVNQTDGSKQRGNARTNQSLYKMLDKMHRPKSASLKKQKKPKPVYGSGGGGVVGGGIGATQIKEVDDVEFYRTFLEQQKQAAMMKRLKPRTDPNPRLPIGIDFFEQKLKNRMAFPPITYAPLYMNNLQRSHRLEEVEASNVQMQHVQMRHPHLHPNHIHHFIDEMSAAVVPTTPIPTIIPSEFAVQNDAQSQTIPPSTDVDIQNESDAAYHGFAPEPEMYKFTIDDVVFKPQPEMVAHPFTGPVTLPPPPLTYQNAQNLHFIRLAKANNQKKNNNYSIMNGNHSSNTNLLPVSANIVYENQFDTPHQTQLNYPPNSPQVNSRLIYHRSNRHPSKNGPFEGASSHQQIQKYSIDPVEITTQFTVTTEKATNNNDTAIGAAVKPVYETVLDSKRTEKRNKKRRQHTDRQKNAARKLNHSQFKDQYGTHLELSNPYTKRRTQGFNSEEEPATTPISPVTLNHSVTHDTAPDTEDASSSKTKSEKVKHFQ